MSPPQIGRASPETWCPGVISSPAFSFHSDLMQTKLPEINANELKAVRDFLTGTTDEVRIPIKPSRPAPHVKAAVPVSNGISRARIRAVKSGV
jgi:hypothetical protein